MTRTPAPERSEDEKDGKVPLFGTWDRAYGAVVICMLLTLLFLHFFQEWPF